MKQIFKKYGWLHDLPDHRDFSYLVTKSAISKLPSKIDLRESCPPVYDQGQLGSCSANAIGGAFEFELLKQKQEPFIPSRLFIYYNERVMENTVNSDSGAMIRDGIKSVNKQGVCSEDIWTYDINKFTQKPPVNCYEDALKHQVLSYQRIVRDLNHFKCCLADGYPFVLGFSVYESFESMSVAETGILNMPGKNEKLLGGHAVVAVGYDDSENRFIIRNSWSDKWGIKGYFTMPYEYLINEKLSNDFWTIRLVEV